MWGLAADARQRPQTMAQWLDLLEKVPFFPGDGPCPRTRPKKAAIPPRHCILCLCGAGALALLAALIHAL